ncbi:MAG: hypothetical protein D6820_10045, partial [Lentisphaerae bacterium]
RNPDRRYLNGESISYKLNTYTLSPPGWPRSGEKWLVRQPYCAAPLRHGQRNANYAFLDTHIQTLGYRQAFGYFYDPDNMP